MDAQIIEYALYDFSEGELLSDERFYNREEAQRALETELDSASELWKEWGHSNQQEARDSYAEDLKVVKLQVL